MDDKDLIHDVLVPAFWYTAETIGAQLFIPIVALLLFMTLITAILPIGKR